MAELTYVGIPIVALLIGILEVLKKTGLNPKYIPITSLVLGIIGGIVLFGDGDMTGGVVTGLFMGLSAIGVYSGTKNTLE